MNLAWDEDGDLMLVPPQTGGDYYFILRESIEALFIIAQHDPDLLDALLGHAEDVADDIRQAAIHPNKRHVA